MIKNCCFIITIPIKVNFMWFFMCSKWYDILWKPETIVTEVIGKCERMVFAPCKHHLVYRVLIWKQRSVSAINIGESDPEALQLEKSTGQNWTSNGYNTKSISHFIIIVAPEEEFVKSSETCEINSVTYTQTYCTIFIYSKTRDFFEDLKNFHFS